MTLVFPQLNTGAVGQYPLIRRRRYSGVTNILSDGSMVSYHDSAPTVNSWDLTLRDLTDMEAESIRNLFQAVEGRRGSFTFLDPTANLLAHSEEFEKSCWDRAPMLQVTAGVDDPLGGMRAIRLINAGQSVETLSQSLTAPAWFGYCFSVYARSRGNSPLSLTRSASSGAHTRVFPLGSGWMRCVLSGALNTLDQTVRFTLELPPGASVDVFGMQAEAQPSASAYKPSGARNGVFEDARFDADVLEAIADGPDQHRVDLRIVAKD